jgi:ribosomal protein S18 acetylase RimI-like enzyme/ribosomal protein S27AE
MEVRQATPAEGDGIRDVVERSMLASYSLAPGTITAAVEEWFGADPLAEKLADDERSVLVVERDGEIVGVADAAYVPESDTGDVLWLHVDPDYRGDGIGRALFEATRDWLGEAGAEHVRGLVLANNADGNAFYRELGFERVGEREVDIDGTPHTEHVYHDEGSDRMTVLEDGNRTVYVDMEGASRGSLGPFFTVYSDAERSKRYGFQCGHCEALATAMDSMGRVECGDCGNTRKPTRWDAAYL